MFCLPVCMCSMCVSGVLRGQEKVSGLLELALQKPVRHNVGDGTQAPPPTLQEQ